MKKTFTRALSGLLAAALIVAMPVAAAAEDGIATYSVSEVSSVCNHTAAATNDTVKAVKTVAPTCTTPGYTEYSCKECGQVFYGSYKGMLGHNYQEETLSNGDIKYTCTTCKRSFTLSASAGKHDHIGTSANLVAEVHTATCKSYGYTVYTCNIPGCGYEQYGDYSQPLAHTYGEWEIVKDATETTCGTARHYCQVCGEAETVHTAKLTPYSKQGRITKDLTPVYNSESGNTVVMYLAKGVTFEFANVKYGSRYKVSAFKDVYGKTSASGEYYVAIDSVEVDPGTVPVYTAYTGLQKIVTVTTDGRLNVNI